MGAPTLTIVMPTITGREHWLEKALLAFTSLTSVDHEILVEVDHPGCGLAWQAGGERAQGSYIYMAADDVEPMEGWDTAAIEACDRGVLPAPRIYHTDGRLQSCGGSWETLERDGAETRYTRAPFMSREQWEVAQPMLPCHYYTDDWVSWRCRKMGIPSVVTYGYRLIHHLAPEGRNEAPRMQTDLDIFRRATEGENVWLESS